MALPPGLGLPQPSPAPAASLADQQVSPSNLPPGQKPPRIKLPVAETKQGRGRGTVATGLPLHVMNEELGALGFSLLDMQSCKVSGKMDEESLQVETYTDKKGKTCTDAQGRPLAAIPVHYEIIVIKDGVNTKVEIDSIVYSNIPIPIGGSERDIDIFNQKVNDALFMCKQQARTVFDEHVGNAGKSGFNRVKEDRVRKFLKAQTLQFAYEKVTYTPTNDKVRPWHVFDTLDMIVHGKSEEQKIFERQATDFSEFNRRLGNTFRRDNEKLSHTQGGTAMRVRLVGNDSLFRHMSSKLPSKHIEVTCSEMKRYNAHKNNLESEYQHTRQLALSELTPDEFSFLVDEEVRKGTEGLSSLSNRLANIEQYRTQFEKETKELGDLQAVQPPADQAQADREKELIKNIQNTFSKIDAEKNAVDNDFEKIQKHLYAVTELQEELGENESDRKVKTISRAQEDHCRSELEKMNQSLNAYTQKYEDMQAKVKNLRTREKIS